MTQDCAIRAEGLTKRYELGSGGSSDSLRDLLTKGVSAIAAGRRTPKKAFFALQDVSFEIARGENVGVIGSNGAGKSTLLKILSRITVPTRGQAQIVGRVGALLEVGTGFHFELTGRENTYLYGAILGMSRAEIEAKFDAIVEFAEMGEFIDTPVKRYSSGMYVRLAFAVAAHLRPDILLLDEVLAVGDLAFQRKCIAFVRELQKDDATILFVSHNMFSIKTMCDRVIYLKNGRVDYDGAVDGGIERYDANANLSVVPWSKEKPEDWRVVITDTRVQDAAGADKSLFDFGERMKIRVKYDARERIREPNFMVAFVRSDGVGCSVYTNQSDGLMIDAIEGEGEIELITPPLKLIAERYIVHVLVRTGVKQDLLCAQVGRAFHVRHPYMDVNYGVFHEPAQWRALVGEGSGELARASG